MMFNIRIGSKVKIVGDHPHSGFTNGTIYYARWIVEIEEFVFSKT